MRITGGYLGGRQLIAPDGGRVRPTSDKTRQAIFNILRHKDFGVGFTLDNAAVIDLFAGTGAMGIEALSQGARCCLFVDDDADSRALQRENIEALGLTGSTKIWRRDATSLGPISGAPASKSGSGDSREPVLRPAARPNRNPSGGPFGLAFLDPPYRKGLVSPALASLRDGGWLAPGALVVVETSQGETFAYDGFARVDIRGYGETEVTFLFIP